MTIPLVRTAIILLLLTLAILLPRLFDLGAFQAADEKMWIANTQGFTKNLALGRWDKLLQQPHPGITTQWLGALTINSPSLATRKIPLAIGQSIIIGLIGYIFYRLWDKWPAILLTLLLALNPLLIAHTRVYAMDSLLALFLLLSVGCLLLWHKTNGARYLAFSAIAGALAVLSKLPGIIIVPFVLFALAWWATTSSNRSDIVKKAGLWVATFLITLVVVFPSLLLNFSEVKHLTTEFLLEGDAQDTHHTSANYTYYLQTLMFFSTPLHLVTLATLIIIPVTSISGGWRWLKHQKPRGDQFSRSRCALPAEALAKTGAAGTPLRPTGFAGHSKRRENSIPEGLINTQHQMLTLIAFTVLFIAQMTLGAKKGDRYILPSFLFLDTLTVIAFFSLISRLRTRRLLLVTSYCLLVTGLLWQAADVIRLHPHTLAYVNPLTKPFYGNRRLGWGEGFDLAAAYLNQKPNAAELTVASLYPTEFDYNFVGQVIPLNHYHDANADYVVLYRALFERGPDTWQTDILNQFANQTPEKIITLNGLNYLWIYKR